MDKPIIYLIHALPGRLRLKLSISPQNIERFEQQLLIHKGVKQVQFNSLTKSILIYYDRFQTEMTEVLNNISRCFSTECNMCPVNLVPAYKKNTIDSRDYYAGLSVLIAWVFKLTGAPQDMQRILDYNAGFSSLISVIKHGMKEMEESGAIDPEVASVIYLINNMLKGNILAGATITWLMTFGRHILEKSVAEGIIIQGSSKHFIHIFVQVLGRLIGFRGNIEKRYV